MSRENRAHNRLVRNTLTLLSGTGFSRILGFVRDIVIARFFGTSHVVEAFLAAFRLPNVMRSLLGEEAVDSVVVPVISEHRDGGDFPVLARRLITAAGILLGITALAGVLAAPLLSLIVAGGFLVDRPEAFRLTVDSVRIVFPYILLVGLSANLAGILYVRNRYSIPAYSPAILNVVLIAGVFVSSRFSEGRVQMLSAFVLIAGALQLALHWLACRRYLAPSESPLNALRDLRLRSMLRLFVPRLWSVAVYHVNVLVVDTLLASFSFIVGAGAIAAIYYANRFVQLPLAVFGLSVTRAMLPDLSYHASRDQAGECRRIVSFAFKQTMFFVVPMTVFFATYPRLFIGLFSGGEFGAYSMGLTVTVLFYYSFGILAYAGARLFVNVCYAFKDTTTPARTATVALIVNICLSLLLMYPLKAGGLALASSIAAWVNALLLFGAARRYSGGLERGVLSESLRYVIASAVAVIAVWPVMLLLPEELALRRLLLAGGVGAAAYAAAGYLLRMDVLRHGMAGIFGQGTGRQHERAHTGDT